MKPRPRYRSVLTALLAAVAAAVSAAPGTAAEIKSVQRLGNAAPSAFGLVEWRVEITGDFSNPYDAADVALDAQIIAPDGERVSVPGFHFEPMSVTLVDGAETIMPDGDAEWRVRYRPDQAGEHRIVFTLSDGSSHTASAPRTFTVGQAAAGSDTRGVIGISPDNPLAFAYASGDPFVPIGLNTCTPPGSIKKGPPTRVFEFDKWFDAMQAQGMNFGRVWLAPSYNPLCLYRELGKVDAQAAARVDHVISKAEANDLKLMLCIEVHLNLQNQKYFWKTNPMNAANGGPIKYPGEFWSNAEARRLYKNRLRYITARWGHSPAVFAWEFWNEANLVTAYDKWKPAVREWHAEMADYLRAVDPYDRLVTTSTAHAKGPADELDSLPQLDFTQTHLYGSDDAMRSVETISEWRPTGHGVAKPHLFGEFGPRHNLGRVEEDTQGVCVKNALWPGVLAATPATPMYWWWNSYIEQNELWSLYGPVASFMADVPAAAGPTRSLNGATFVLQSPPADPQPVALHVAGHWVLWEPSEPNSPQTLTLDEAGRVKNIKRLSQMLHGTGNHPTWHNPVTFEASYRKPGTFSVHVETVAKKHGADLKVYLNDKLIKQQAYPGRAEQADPNAAPQPGTLTIDVPAGQHAIRVANEGQDWVRASYTLTGPVLDDRPGVDVVGRILDHAEPSQAAVIGWIRNRQFTWLNVVDGKPVEPVPASRLTLTDLPEGAYELQWWNTDTGKHETGPTLTTNGGRVDMSVPAFETDIAFKLIRQP